MRGLGMDRAAFEVALDALLGSKSSLIGSWVNYQTDRMQLLLDLEALQRANQDEAAEAP